MAPKLEEDDYEKRLQKELTSSVAAAMKANPEMTPQEAALFATLEILKNNPFQPPKEGKCPINDLPNELLAYVFQIGVKDEDEEDEEEEDEDEWEDMSDDDDHMDSDDAPPPKLANSHTSVSTLNTAVEDECSDVHIPFQVLVSHVCRRWREVALDTHGLWNFLSFNKRPSLEMAKMFISRSQGLPLTIYIDCTMDGGVDEEDHPDHPLYAVNNARKMTEQAESSEDDDNDLKFISQKELSQILDLIEPEVSHWLSFDFQASTYNYVYLLLSRLHKFSSAPLLETFQVCLFEDSDDYEFFNGDDKTSYLPFQGVAPRLKDVVLWGVHIDWDGAVPSFLRDLKALELSYHAKDVRPSYKTFSQMIFNSPDLETLSLTLSGPVLPDGVAFDDDPDEKEGAWGPTPLCIPTLREFAIQYHDSKYASALVQHLDLPNLTSLLLNFDEEDYTSFVQTLLLPVKGRTQSLLHYIENLKISGLPCDVATIERFLGQLNALTSLNLKVFGEEELVLYKKLMDPYACRPPTSSITSVEADLASSQSSSSRSSFSTKPLPTVFCPRLQNLSTTMLTGKQIKALVIARAKLGAPLKRLQIAFGDIISEKEEEWLRENVEELEFFDASDSEDEFTVEGDITDIDNMDETEDSEEQSNDSD